MGYSQEEHIVQQTLKHFRVLAKDLSQKEYISALDSLLQAVDEECESAMDSYNETLDEEDV